MIEILAKDPIPVAYLQVPSKNLRDLDYYGLLSDLEAALDRRLLLGQFRGVGLDRLVYVLKTGIDVDPPDAPFFAETFQKAWEYGGFPKLVLALDPHRLFRTFKEVPASTPDDELVELRRTYPTLLPSQDGQQYWLTRLPEDDPRIATPYEYGYAWWIPDDPLLALRACLIFDLVGGSIKEAALAAISS